MNTLIRCVETFPVHVAFSAGIWIWCIPTHSVFPCCYCTQHGLWLFFVIIPLFFMLWKGHFYKRIFLPHWTLSTDMLPLWLVGLLFKCHLHKNCCNYLIRQIGSFLMYCTLDGPGGSKFSEDPNRICDSSPVTDTCGFLAEKSQLVEVIKCQLPR